MTWMDHALVGAFAVLWPVWGLLGHEKYKARVRAGFPGTRLAAYSQVMILEWLFVTAACALWIHLARDWSWIGLVGLGTPASWWAMGVAAVLAALLLAQSAQVARSPETHLKLRGSLVSFAEVLPVDRSDFTGFLAVSITAGVCEEILYRGLLGWYFGQWLGVWGGQAAAVLMFGAAHAYLGARASIRTLLAGAVAAGLYLWCGSLLPSILLHAVIDISSGWMAYEVLRERPTVPSAAGA